MEAITELAHFFKIVVLLSTSSGLRRQASLKAMKQVHIPYDAVYMIDKESLIDDSFYSYQSMMDEMRG